MARLFRATVWSSLIGAMQDSGYGFYNAWINSWAATITALLEEVFGRTTQVGKYTTVLVIRSAEVSLVWVR